MTAFSPLVSIVIPTYQRPHLVMDAVRSALAQKTSVPFDVFVLENPGPEVRSGGRTPTEHALDAVKDDRLRYARHDLNLGMTGNWNEGLRSARGQWVVILHDDDWLSESFLSSALAAATKFPDAAVVGCERRVWRGGIVESGGEATGGIGRFRARPLAAEDLFLWNPYPAMSGVMFRREPALAAGGFDESFFPSSDYAMWLRLARTARAVRLGIPLVNYGISANESRRPETIVKMALADLRLREELLSRRRPSAALSLFSRYKVLDDVRSFGRFWGTDVDALLVQDRFGLRRLTDRAVAHIVFRGVRRYLLSRRALRRWTWIEMHDRPAGTS